MNTTGWICPKCKKVWAPVVLECTDCNCADHLRGGAIPYDPFEISPYTIYGAGGAADILSVGRNLVAH